MYLGIVLSLISMLSGGGGVAAAEEVIKTGHITSCGG